MESENNESRNAKQYVSDKMHLPGLQFKKTKTKEFINLAGWVY